MTNEISIYRHLLLKILGGKSVQDKRKLNTDWTVFFISGGFLLLFIIVSFIDSEMVGHWITVSFDASAKFFGGYWQLLLLGNFLIGIYLRSEERRVGRVCIYWCDC